MTATTTCDSDLMSGICARDAAAFEVLAARYREPLRRCLRRMVRDPGAADDLLQEVMLRVWTRADQWDGRGPVRAWLFRIATNLALNHQRALRRRRERPFDLPPEDAAGGEEPPVPLWLMDAAARPEQQVEQAERSRRLRRLIATLPVEKRDVLRLVCEEEMDLREVAERLDIPEGTAKSRLHYARKWLSRQWNTLEREGEEPL